MNNGRLHRYLVPGFLAGRAIAWACGYVEDVIVAARNVTFVDSKAGLGASNIQVAVEQLDQQEESTSTTVKSLQADLQKMKQELADLKNQKGTGDCPPGYTQDTSATGITLCKRGADEMVKAGSFWVDRYEMSIVDATQYKDGACNGPGTPYGASSDNYPTAFPDSGDFTVPLYACSVKGQMPSARMTWFQAALACELSGKRLCSNYQWQVAALGTPDDSTSCNVSTSATEAAGARSKCVSKWGAHDMVGNVWEWVAWWSVAGRGWMTVDGQYTTPWPSGYGDGKDRTWNLDGRTNNGSAMTNGMPAAALRGGDWNDGPDAGVFAVSLATGPSRWGTSYGARCCRQ